MTVPFKLNNVDFLPLSFSTLSKPASSVPASLSFATACRSSSYVSALSHKSLSDSTNVCDDTVSSSHVYPSKPIRLSKPVGLSNVSPSKPIISNNFCLRKTVCPRSISFCRSIRSSDVCQSRSNVIPSKPARPSNACLTKTARPSKFYSSKPVCPSNICPNKPVSLSNTCLSKPARVTTVFPSKPVRPINVCPSKPARPNNVYYSKPVCPSNDCQSKPVGLIKVSLQNPRFVIKALIFNLFLVLLFFPVYVKLSVVILNIFIDLILFKVILLYNFTCLKTRLILFISLNGSYFRSMLDAVIIFQSFGIILNVSFFTRLLRIFAIFNITVLNFAKRTSFSNICTDVLILRQNLRILLPKPVMVCLLFIFWLLSLSITGFVMNIVLY